MRSASFSSLEFGSRPVFVGLAIEPSFQTARPPHSGASVVCGYLDISYFIVSKRFCHDCATEVSELQDSAIAAPIPILQISDVYVSRIITAQKRLLI